MIKNMLSVVMGYRRIQVAELARIAKLKYDTVDRIYRNETKGIDFETLNKLCFALECTPNDIFKYVPD